MDRAALAAAPRAALLRSTTSVLSRASSAAQPTLVLVRGMCSEGKPGQLTRIRQFKSAGINDVLMPNTTQLKYGLYGIRAITGRRVSAATIEAIRRTIRRKIKKTARLWIRMQATVPVTRKPVGIRMGKGKGAISFYAAPVRPGQIIFEMDRLPRKVAMQALQAAQPKFPCRLGFVEWS